jgi:hypothetical protein
MLLRPDPDRQFEPLSHPCLNSCASIRCDRRATAPANVDHVMEDSDYASSHSRIDSLCTISVIQRAECCFELRCLVLRARKGTRDENHRRRNENRNALHRNWSFVKVLTGQPGLHGWCDANLEWKTRAHRYIRRSCRGEGPRLPQRSSRPRAPLGRRRHRELVRPSDLETGSGFESLHLSVRQTSILRSGNEDHCNSLLSRLGWHPEPAACQSGNG